MDVEYNAKEADYALAHRHEWMKPERVHTPLVKIWAAGVPASPLVAEVAMQSGIGHHLPIPRRGELQGLRLSGFPGWLMWLVVHITFLTGFKNRFTSLLYWANRTGVGSRARTDRLTVPRGPGMRTMAAEQDQARRVSSNGSPAWADRTERSHVLSALMMV